MVKLGVNLASIGLFSACRQDHVRVALPDIPIVPALIVFGDVVRAQLRLELVVLRVQKLSYPVAMPSVHRTGADDECAIRQLS